MSPDHPLELRLELDGRARRAVVDAGRFVAPDDLAPPDRPETIRACSPFVDIQMNGRWGVSFSDPDVTARQVVAILRAQPNLGVAKVCPTLITAGPEATLAGIRAIMEAVHDDELVARIFAGIHLEGPWISEVDGFRGAHPLAAVRDPDVREFDRWYEAAEGRISIVTLAPERPGAVEAIEHLVRLGVVVAIGHSRADRDAIARAVDAGARLATHIGNGVAANLPRHPNPIWDQLAENRLHASFIPDGKHVEASILLAMMRAKTFDRSILVSDFSPLAGLPVGRYGPWAVDPSGKVVVAETPYLAGAWLGLREGVALLAEAAGGSSRDADDSLSRLLVACTENPARLLGLTANPPALGTPADLLIYRSSVERRFEHLGTFVAGSWFPPDEPEAPWTWESLGR
ncbi:MAG: N-acetylglucosamine-6-phosphate deacetylase [Isosphaeraceae bacterium]|nr:N-acetylglucosamine-6-phosphate deacetylase [Isosphaeraceae bacterium]